LQIFCLIHIVCIEGIVFVEENGNIFTCVLVNGGDVGTIANQILAIRILFFKDEFGQMCELTNLSMLFISASWNL
jgi:hypothetical protein